MSVTENMFKTERPNSWSVELREGVTLFFERHHAVEAWSVRTFTANRTYQPHDSIATDVTRAEAEAVAEVLLHGGSRSDAQAAGKAICNA